jgi:hypothetical protein
VDLNVQPRRDVPKWSETRWNGCWNPDQGVGLYMHMGRFRKDLDVWWVQLAAYLPDEQLVVDRVWGRCTDAERVRVGGFELRQREFGWISSFDGVGQLSTIEELAAGTRGSSAPSSTVRWEVEAEPATPAWDLYGGDEGKHDFAGDTHIQQGFHTKGRLIVDGVKYRLDGVGMKDHSSGVRDWDNFGHHHFTLAVMPGVTIHEAVITPATGDRTATIGTVIRGGEQSPVLEADFPVVQDARGGPRTSPMIVTDASGQTTSLEVELVHALPITITSDNDNINGIDWELDEDPMILIEGIGRFTDAEGNVGYGMHERSQRRSALQRPVLQGSEVRS